MEQPLINGKNGYFFHSVSIFRGGSRAAARSKMECFVIIVNPLTIITKRFQPLTIITKRSILNVAAALDPPIIFLQSFDVNVYFRVLL